jgi:acyl carrier protein
MNIQQIEADIINFLQKNILAENVSLKADMVLRDVGVDSFSIVEIILFIERKYGLIIPDQYLIPDNFKSVTCIAQLIIRLSY